MSTLYIAAYCENSNCASGLKSYHEIELPDDFSDLGDLATDVQAWAMAQLESLGWSIVGGEHRCPECTENQRLKDLSGLHPD